MTVEACEIVLVERWDDDCLSALSALHGHRLGGKWTDRWNTDLVHWRWKLAQSPAGPAVGALAMAGSKVVGSATAVFKYLDVDGERVRVAELGDLAVAPDFQGRGLLRAMAKTVTKSAGPQTELLYSIPNKNGSAALLATRLFEPIPAIRHRTWLKPLLTPALVTGPRMEPVPTNFASLSKSERFIRPVFDADWATYRIGAHPDGDGYVWIQAADGQGVIGKIAHLQGKKALLIGKILEGDTARYRACLSAAISAARQAGCRFVAGWACGAPSHTASLLSHFFVPLQVKRVMVAEAAISTRLRGRLNQVRLEMLDSDKI